MMCSGLHWSALVLEAPVSTLQYVGVAEGASQLHVAGLCRMYWCRPCMGAEVAQLPP